MSGPVEGDVLDGKYRLERKLGEGGMGAVYLGEHLGTGRKVAVKLLLQGLAQNAEVVHRFQMEARAAAAIGHPGVVDVYDTGLADGAPYLVMELLEGESLGERLARPPPLAVPELCALLAEAVDALAAAHAKGVIHRDLKPDNLFLPANGKPAIKLLDFGLARFASGASPVKTAAGSVMGTPLYMAPEQARGGEVGPSADLYSVGAILHDALTGQPPFPGESFGEVLAQVLTAPYRPLLERRPDLPRELTSLVDRLLSRDPAARPTSASAVASALRGVADQVVSTAPTIPVVKGGTAPTVLRGPASAPTELSRAAPKPAPARAGGGRRPLLIGGGVALLALVAAVPMLLKHRAIKPGTQRTEPRSKLAFAYAPKGRFTAGCEAGSPHCAAIERARPAQVEAFWLGVTPVTVAAYRACAESAACADEPLTWEGPKMVPGVCNAKAGRADHPMNCLTWKEADAFCRWVGGRLPTGEEYEWAARSGGQARLYPWGDAPPDGTRANYCDKRCPSGMPEDAAKRMQEKGGFDAQVDDGYATTSPVGHYPAGATAWGLLDMSGDVLEWTASDLDDENEEARLTKEVRGGGFFALPQGLRTAFRRGRPPDRRADGVGFRCVIPAPWPGP